MGQRAKKSLEATYPQMSGRLDELVRGLAHGVNEAGGLDADVDRFRINAELQRLVGRVIVASIGMSPEQLAAVQQQDLAMMLRQPAQKAPAVPQPPPPLSAMIVAEFTASVDRDDPKWAGPLDRATYSYVNPALSVDHFQLQGSGVTTEKFVDIDFVEWDHNPTTREILAEATRLGYDRLDRPASESSLNVRPTGPNGRPVVCICTDEWQHSDARLVGFVIGRAGGRYLNVYRLGLGWHHGGCVFRFAARK